MSPAGLLYPEDSFIQNLHAKLTKAARDFNTPDRHLRRLIDRPERFFDFSIGIAGFFMDFSRQRLDENALSLLREAQILSNALEKFKKNDPGGNRKPNRKSCSASYSRPGLGSFTALVQGDGR